MIWPIISLSEKDVISLDYSSFSCGKVLDFIENKSVNDVKISQFSVE